MGSITKKDDKFVNAVYVTKKDDKFLIAEGDKVFVGKTVNEVLGKYCVDEYSLSVEVDLSSKEVLTELRKLSAFFPEKTLGALIAASGLSMDELAVVRNGALIQKIQESFFKSGEGMIFANAQRIMAQVWNDSDLTELNHQDYSIVAFVPQRNEEEYCSDYVYFLLKKRKSDEILSIRTYSGNNFDGECPVLFRSSSNLNTVLSMVPEEYEGRMVRYSLEKQYNGQSPFGYCELAEDND